MRQAVETRVQLASSPIDGKIWQELLMLISSRATPFGIAGLKEMYQIIVLQCVYGNKIKRKMSKNFLLDVKHDHHFYKNDSLKIIF